MQEAVNKTWFFRQQPSEVWEYLTQPELIEQWLMKTDFKPVAGYKFCFTFVAKPGSKYGGVVNCEVLEVKPFSKLSYTWNGGTQDESRHFNSTIVWTLVPKDNGTELQLRHDGFEVLEDVINHSAGWDNCLQKFDGLINHSTK